MKVEMSMKKLGERREFNIKAIRKYRFQSKSKEKVEISIEKR